MTMKFLIALAAILTSVRSEAGSAPKVFYHVKPKEVWRLTFTPVGPGNGAFLSPDGDMLAVATQTGHVRAYTNITGQPQTLWTYIPAPALPGGSVRSKSSINFFLKDSKIYLAFSLIDVAPGEDTTSRIIVLNENGTKVWESTGLAGETTPSPQVSLDGRYVAVTSNFNQTGYFSLFDSNAVVNSSVPVAPVFQYESEHVSDNQTTPFSDLGYFPAPNEGFYVDPSGNGALNNHDLFMWMSDTNTDVRNANGDPLAGIGQIYVFQFPLGYDHSGNGLNVILVGSARTYQSPTRPIITNRGRTVYWSTVRGEIRGWIGELFNRANNGLSRVGRGNPPFIAPRAPPTLSSGEDYMVFGPGSASMVWKADANLTVTENVTTDQPLYNRVLITADNEYIIYGTPGGMLVMTSAANLTDQLWQVGSYRDINFGSIQGEMALDPSGTMLYVTTNMGNVAGSVIGIEIGQGPTESPTWSPSASPSAAPSCQPTSLPTFTPSAVPTAATFSDYPSLSPSVSPTASVAPTLIEKIAVPTPDPAPLTPLEPTEQAVEETPTSGSVKLVGDSVLCASWFMTMAALIVGHVWM